MTRSISTAGIVEAEAILKNQIKAPSLSAKITRTRKPDNMSLEQWQILLRRQYATEQKFRVKNIGGQPILSDFAVANLETKRTYRVAIRSLEPGLNFCQCPDFEVNTLGTCKHIEFMLARLVRKRGGKKAFEQGYSRPYSSVFLKYGLKREVRLRIGAEAPVSFRELATEYFETNGSLKEDAFNSFDQFILRAMKIDHELRCYDDAVNFIANVRDRLKRESAVDTRYPQGIETKDIDSLLKAPLFPYQKKGVLFAAKTGRCILADDMGLGKTIQAIGAVEILANETRVEKAVIICPTSLKYQWKSEIERFTDRSAEVIEGLQHKRKEKYHSASFYKIVNYDIIHKDIAIINDLAPDIVILDEAQRIKNWNTRTAMSVKKVKSPHAIVLTGTPLENRIEELHSIVEFVDRQRLGPLFRFLYNHQILDSTGRVIGYKNLRSIGETLGSIMLRRKKEDELKQLPERLEKNFFVPMTPEQWNIHNEHAETVSRIVAKWRRYGFLTETDQRILLVSLNCMRMVCDNTFILDQKTRFGPKVDEVQTLLGEILEEKDVKTVVFSQWERMNFLVAERLDKTKIRYEYLHGGVPSKKRKDLIQNFREDPQCRVFLSTDAGGVGLNLQNASVVVNLDLPWNPAVLEQRIGRVHRMGQHRPVRVIKFVSEGTIEHGLLDVLRFKKSVFSGVLERGKDEVLMGENRLKKFIKTIEEVTSNIPHTDCREQESEAQEQLNRRKASNHSDKSTYSWDNLLTSGLSFMENLEQMLSRRNNDLNKGFSSLIEKDAATGQKYLKIPIQDEKTVETVSRVIDSLSKIFGQLLK